MNAGRHSQGAMLSTAKFKPPTHESGSHYPAPTWCRKPSSGWMRTDSTASRQSAPTALASSAWIESCAMWGGMAETLRKEAGIPLASGCGPASLCVCTLRQAGNRHSTAPTRKGAHLFHVPHSAHPQGDIHQVASNK